MKDVITENSSNVGDTVLDMFMGSGSTGVACVNTNRRFIGIEMEEKYFNIGVNRMSATEKDCLNKETNNED
jgi:site-specific DNA-methyltransferase (adenine-specific)